MPMQSFLVRIWLSEDEPTSGAVHGVLERAGAPGWLAFRDDAELLSLAESGPRGLDKEDQREREEQ